MPNEKQGDLFQGTEYERGEDINKSKKFRDILSSVNTGPKITMRFKNIFGETDEIEVNEDSYREIILFLKKIKKDKGLKC